MSNEQKESEPNKPKTLYIGYWLAIGVVFGIGLGVAMDNLTMGLAIGVALGEGIGMAQNYRNKNK